MAYSEALLENVQAYLKMRVWAWTEVKDPFQTL